MSVEHWRSQMSCVGCKQTPNVSPLYQCSMGHIICLRCFKEAAKLGYPKCIKCPAEMFKCVHVSTSFLERLTQAPKGFRPNRYGHKTKSVTEESPSSDDDNSIYELISSGTITKKNMTVEQLFRLDTAELQSMLSKKSDDRELKCDSQRNSKQTPCVDEREITNKSDNIGSKSNSSISLKKKASPTVTLPSSRKPLNCPHDPCNKIIAISSFDSHFRYDHPEISRYPLERGKELCLAFDLSQLEHGRTICLGLIVLYDETKAKSIHESPSVHANGRPFDTSKIPIDTFWIMTSGAEDETRSRSYGLFWLFNNNVEYYNCTLEICSQNCAASYSAFCAVNDMHDSQNIAEIIERLNCLYLRYGCLRNLLFNGGKAELRIAIH